MLGKKKPSTQELILEEMKNNGYDTNGVSVARPLERGFDYWVVKDGRVIGEYNVTFKRLKMYTS